MGRPFVYADRANESLLMLRELFRLPYRLTEILGRALMKLLEADVAVPDFTSLAKRAGKRPSICANHFRCVRSDLFRFPRPPRSSQSASALVGAVRRGVEALRPGSEFDSKSMSGRPMTFSRGFSIALVVAIVGARSAIYDNCKPSRNPCLS